MSPDGPAPTIATFIPFGKNICNPDISALFDDAASDLPLPEERVTNKARLALQERKAEQKILRPAPETGCESRVTGSFYHEYRFYLLAAVMAALLIVVAFFSANCQ